MTRVTERMMKPRLKELKIVLLKNMIKDSEAQIDQEEQPVQRIENVIGKLIMISEVDYDQSY